MIVNFVPTEVHLLYMCLFRHDKEMELTHRFYTLRSEVTFKDSVDVDLTEEEIYILLSINVQGFYSSTIPEDVHLNILSKLESQLEE